MPYPRELLNSAIAFSQVHPDTEATRRRAVSTAYYSLFHFLIEETCRNWARPEQRGTLARLFEHKTMFAASNRRVEAYDGARRGSPEFHLYSVAYAFCRLQIKRHEADYDISRPVPIGDVGLNINLVEGAFTSWLLVQTEPIAHDYLFSLLFKSRG